VISAADVDISAPGHLAVGSLQDESMTLSDVNVVVSPEQLERVGAFRYSVYVQEQGKHAPHADHATRVLIEPADRAASSVVCYVERGGGIVASLRIEFLEAQDQAHATSFSVFNFVPSSQMLFFSRLMVATDSRCSPATARLLQFGFALAIMKDRSLGLLTCKPALVPLFERFGCLQYADSFMHADHGLQSPMAILGEVAYLRERAAPLADWLDTYRQQSPYTERFLAVARASSARPRPREARALVA
jgi:nucleotide-binding universal stress UspA family protein